MRGRVLKYAFGDLGLTTDQIERFMGYSEGDDTSIVRALVEEIMLEAEEIADIKAQFAIFGGLAFNRDKASVAVGGYEFDVHRIVFGQLRKSEAAALFLCTAGDEIGRRSRKAMAERDLLRGYVYDAVGSEIAEATADLMQEEVRKAAAAEGMTITNRYSPGYCGWSVSEQHKLFALIPYNYCGIRLTVSALMDPVKSVSGIIGMGHEVRFNAYTCSMCEMHDCIYRRLRAQGTVYGANKV